MPYVSPAHLNSLSIDKYDTWTQTHTPLGHHPRTGDTLYIPDVDRYAGTYILGKQGTGKSGLLQNLIAHDVYTGNAVIVIDPHGDLVIDCLAHLPEHRLAQTYLLDMDDEAWPFGVNLFNVGKLATSKELSAAVDRLMHIFEVLWPEVMSHQYLPLYVQGATIVLLANPGSTLVDMYAFLRDAGVRQAMLQKLSPEQTDVRQFWQVEYDSLSPAERARRVQPLITRLHKLFMGRSLVRNIVGQRQSTIDFRKAIENREVVFIRLPGKTDSRNAELIGTIIVAQIHRAIFSFGDVPQPKRPGVSLYVDEFQNFVSPDFNELFTEGRKFGVRLTLAHQYRGQLPTYLQDSTLTARTIVCFQTQIDDASKMAKVFPATDTTVRPEDVEVHTTRYLLTQGSDDPAIQDFIEIYLRPMDQNRRRGGRLVVDEFRFDWMQGERLPDPTVDDPTSLFDNLMRDVMRKRSAWLPIPPQLVEGFSNCGQRFYKQARHLRANDPLLLAGPPYPAGLVVQAANGELHWTRWPEDGSEQLYHFIFLLRLMMEELADHPIGTVKLPSAADVAQMLTSLTHRAAFVHTGNDVGVIYTHDTPQRVNNREQVRRAWTILKQTRKKYCHSRQEVERLILPAHAPSAAPVQPVSRWEEVD